MRTLVIGVARGRPRGPCPQKFLEHIVTGVRRYFSRGGQSRHCAYLFLVVDDAKQIDVYKKTISNVTTIAYSVFLV